MPTCGLGYYIRKKYQSEIEKIRDREFRKELIELANTLEQAIKEYKEKENRKI
jgi:hypothetical protein